MYKIKTMFELTADQVESIITQELKEQLRYAEENTTSSDPDDIKYDKKIAKALRKVLEHYGEEL